MAEAPYIYSLLIEIGSEKGAAYLAWLDHKHIADVAGFPGFLWARRVRLEEPAEDGWTRYLVIYGLESRQVFEAYRNSALFRGFAVELEAFAGQYRLERFFGEVDLRIG